MVNYSKLPTQFVETLILHANTSYQDLEVAGGGVNPQNETASHEAVVICLEEVLHLDTLVPLATLTRLDLTNSYKFTKTRLADQKVVPKRVFALTFHL